MGSEKPLPTKCWIKYLLSKGFECTRIKGSHYQYTKRGALRSIPVRENEKEVPRLHIMTACRTIGVSTKEVYDWAAENC